MSVKMIASQEGLSQECGCGNPLPPFGDPFPCIQCETQPLCAWCATRDVPLCQTCHSSQMEAAEICQASLRCPGCKNLYRTLLTCKTCACALCGYCVDNPVMHECVRCNACPGGKQIVRCCQRKWCKPCLKQHYSQDCYVYTIYNCATCNSRVRMFGPTRCPYPGCHLYGCARCYSFGSAGQVACSRHCSQGNCPGCHVPYLKHDQGSLRIQQLVGRSSIMVREYCAECTQSMRALIICVWQLQKKRRIAAFPAVLMEMILVRMK